MASPVLLAPAPWRAELRAMLALAWPLILANLTMALIQSTDVVLMGQLSAHALAASALGLNLSLALTIFCMGLVLAASPLMASELGRKRHSVRDVRRTFRQSVWVAVTVTVPAWLLLWNAEPVMIALGQQAALAADAARFLKGYMWSMLPFLIFQAMRHFLAALEQPRWILAVSALGVGLNALVGWALIFGKFGLPALGIFGGGLATSIVWSVMVLALGLVVATQRPFKRYRLFGNFWRADWQRYRAIWRIGLPIAVTLGFEGTVFSFAIYLMGLIDAASVAAHAIALQLAALTFMVPLGIAQAATVRVGLAFGARDRLAIGRAGWTAFVLGVGFMTLMALVMVTIPEALIGIFIDRADPANARVIELGVSFLLIGALFQIVDGAQVVGAGMLRGLQDTRVPMIFAGLGYWVIGIGVGTVLAFGFDWEGVGVWTGLAAGLAVVAVLMVARWSARERLGLLGAQSA
ncbi:MAG: MATE family efflux transporter [Sphingomonadaceae bacterium]